LSEASSGVPSIVLIATGSEVSLALEAQQVLGEKGVETRVVSMPSWELFDRQPESYRIGVLPPDTPKLAIEAGSPHGWRNYVGDRGAIIGIDRFGASAPGETALEELGFRVDRVVEEAVKLQGQ
jgi:transketolase